MRGMAKFIITGRIGNIREAGSALKISIASDYPRKDERGEWESNTHWNTVTVFGEKTVAWIKEKTKPGDLVQTEGRMRQGSYEKGGETVYTVEIISDEFNLLHSHEPKEKDDSEA